MQNHVRSNQSKLHKLIPSGRYTVFKYYTLHYQMSFMAEQLSE